MSLCCTSVSIIVRENVRNTAKNVKSHVFWILKKNVKNVEVITYRSIGLNTVTTLNQFCCPSRAITKVICGAYFNQQ